MRWLLWIFTIIGLVLLFVMEWSVLPGFFSDHIIYLALLVVLLLISRQQMMPALTLALLAGYAHDLYSPLPFGVYFLSYIGVTYFARLLFQTRFKEFSVLSLVAVTALSFIMFILSTIIVDAISVIFSPEALHFSLSESQTFAVFGRIVWTNTLAMVILLVLGVPVFRLFNTRLAIR